MAKDSPYVVLARDLPVHRTFDVPASRVGSWVKGVAMRDALGAPDPDPNAGHGRATLHLYADGTHVFATGKLTGVVTAACSRCVGPVSIAIDEPLHVTFMSPAEMPRDEDSAGDDGAEVTADDIDVFPFDGDHIDLEPLLREQFILAIPFAPLCREDCLGLCAQCGVDRNTTPCTCEQPVDPTQHAQGNAAHPDKEGRSEIDPRLEALSRLKLPS